MEMPEGYARLYKSTDSFKGQFGVDCDKALDLLKEMAEALDLLRVYQSKSFCYEASEALKKFKEWK